MQMLPWICKNYSDSTILSKAEARSILLACKSSTFAENPGTSFRDLIGSAWNGRSQFS